MIKRALISVYDKDGLEQLVKALGGFDVEIVSSGGTAHRIRDMGYEWLTEVAEYTGHPESPGGLLKTLHPKVHGGFLLDRDDPEQRAYMDRHGIEPFDMLVSNLYPFEEVATRGAGLEEAAENIDIGGPTMTRSAAKAALLYGRVAVVIDPSQYGAVIEALEKNDGEFSTEMIRELAEKAFKRTAGYDKAIVEYLKRQEG